MKSGRDTVSPVPEDEDLQHRLTRRRVIGVGGAALAGAAVAASTSPMRAFGRGGLTGGDVKVEDLGLGVVHYAGDGSRLVGETMYIGSRNLTPTRVAAFHVPSGRVTATYMLGNGDFVSGLAADGTDVLYAGVSHSTDSTNLYRIDLTTGEVTGLAAVPGLIIRDLAVAPDGVVYVVGRPRPFGDGPAVFSYDPVSGEVATLAVPEPNADQISAVDVTATTVYCGCNSILTSRTGNGVYAVDRASGAVTRLREGDVRYYAVKVIDDVVAVGSQPGKGQDWFGVLDLSTGVWRDFELAAAQGVGSRDGGLIVLSDHELYRIDLTSWETTHLGTADRGSSKRTGLLDTTVVGSGGSAGFVWTYGLDSKETEIYDLADSGAQGDAMLGLSVAAGDGVACVGGTGVVAVHDLVTRSVTSIRVGTEVKDMIVLDGVVYMAVYSGKGVWEYRPKTAEPPSHVADFPPAQNRPQFVRWDDVNELIAIGVKADTTGGGSLCLFDPATGSLTAHINPLGASQFVRAGATGHGLVYLGGSVDGAATSPAGDIAAWDPVAGKQIWRLSDPLGQNVSSLVVRGQQLFGISVSSTFFVIDLAHRPALVHQVDFSAITSDNASLLLDRGVIYGASAQSLFRVDPVTYQPRVLVDDLAGEWFGQPHLASDEDHWLYTLTGRKLIRVRDRS